MVEYAQVASLEEAEEGPHRVAPDRCPAMPDAFEDGFRFREQVARR